MEKSFNSEDFLSKIFNQIPGAIFLCQFYSDGQFSFPFTSEGIWDLYELQPQEINKNSSLILDRIDKNDREKFISSIKLSASTLTQWELDFSVNLPSKGLRWLRGIAQPEKQPDDSIIFHGYITDITDRKLAARALIKKEQRWHFALESSELGIWDYNFKDRNFYLSKILFESLGYSATSIDYSSEFWFKKIHSEDINQFKIDIQKHIKGKTEIFISENRMQCADGSYKWILHKGKVIEWAEDGSPKRMIGTHSDISEKKEKEILLENNLKLISEQNSRLSNFAYIVSHNLRTHTGNLEALINFIEIAPTQEERDLEFTYLKSVSSQLNETILHLTEVLSIQNNASKEVRKLNLYNFAEKTKITLLKEIEKKDALIINNIPHEVDINHNPAYLESILYNLVSNSLKYSSNKRPPLITLNCAYEENYLVLKVTDNGIGFNVSKHRNDLFGMYKTFHGNKDANGIGLFITKNQIESLGGKIAVESIEGEGSTFYVYFKLNG